MLEWGTILNKKKSLSRLRLFLKQQLMTKMRYTFIDFGSLSSETPAVLATKT